MDDVDAIIKGLSEAQKQLLLNSSPFAIDDAHRYGSSVLRALTQQGLTYCQTSPLGEAVRARLLEEGK